MAAYQPPTADEIRETAEAYFRQRAARAQAVDQPTLVFVGGQPGAGKTAAAMLVRNGLRQAGGFIHLDADRMRERIDLRGAHPTSDQTQVTAGALVAMLRALSLEGRRNLVEEGTFRNADGLQSLVQRIQAAGYRVELVAVATPLEESRLGIYQRFEAQHALQVPNPRFVSDRYHDEAAAGFTHTVAKLEGAFDRVRVINRAGQVHYDTASVQRVGTARGALSRGQVISEDRLVAAASSWESVRQLAQARIADAEYLRSVNQHQAAVVQYAERRREFERAMDDNRVPPASRPALRDAFELEARTRFMSTEVDARQPLRDTAARRAATVEVDVVRRHQDQEHQGPER